MITVWKTWTIHALETSRNLATLSFGLNAPYLSCCVLHPVNTYCASHSIWDFVRVVDWNVSAANTLVIHKHG